MSSQRVAVLRARKREHARACAAGARRFSHEASIPGDVRRSG